MDFSCYFETWSHCEAYLAARAAQKDVEISLTDEWGHVLFPDLEKEIGRTRKWAACGRMHYTACRHLAHLHVAELAQLDPHFGKGRWKATRHRAL